MKDPPIQAVLSHRSLGRIIENMRNPWIKVQLKICKTIRDEYKQEDKMQITQWCASDPSFIPNTMDRSFKSWILKEITSFYSITKKQNLKCFETLKKEYHLKESDSYRYLQIHGHFEDNIKNKTHFDDPLLKIFIGVFQNDLKKGIVSRFYRSLMSKKDYNTEYIKEKWERNGNFSISRKDWLQICQFQSKWTNSHVWREFAWKCLVQFFITPKQKTCFSGGEASCWRLWFNDGSQPLACILGLSSY